jgi:tyrosinase
MRLVGLVLCSVLATAIPSARAHETGDGDHDYSFDASDPTNDPTLRAMSTPHVMANPHMRMTARRSPGDFSVVNAAGADPPPVRADFNTLGNAAVASLRNGIAAMMKLDLKDDGSPKPDADLSPLGWKYQAFIHGVSLARFNAAGRPRAWRTCEHSSWFFLPWHRMELFFFERILRAMSGDNALTLPYWDFTVPDPDQTGMMVGARLPAAFRVKPTDTTPNALWWEFRNAMLNLEPPKPGEEDKAKPLDGTMVATKAAFEQPAFFTNVWRKGLMSFGGGAFSTIPATGPPVIHPPNRAGHGQIEQTPHDQVHVAVGDGSAESMSNPAGAGLDPIFWPVHANIDRAWSCWQKQHPGTEPQSDVWLRTAKFKFFDVAKPVDGMLEAVEVEMTGQEVIDTAAQLGYTYGTDPCKGFKLPPALQTVQWSSAPEAAGAVEMPRSVLSAAAESHAILAGEPVTVSIDLPSDVQERIKALLWTGAPKGSILLTVAGLAVDQPTGASYEVYLNLPENAVPYSESQYYVGNLSFFGVGYHQHDHPQHGHSIPDEDSNSSDITDVVRQLVSNGEWRGNQVSVTFVNTAADTPDSVKAPAAPAEARARFTSVSLTAE